MQHTGRPKAGAAVVWAMA